MNSMGVRPYTCTGMGRGWARCMFLCIVHQYTPAHRAHSSVNTSLEKRHNGTQRHILSECLKRDDGQIKQERRKTAEYAGFQVSITCLSWVVAVTNVLIRFLAEFRGAFTCVCVCKGGQRGRKRL